MGILTRREDLIAAAAKETGFLPYLENEWSTKMIYQLWHFNAQEILDPETFQKFGDEGIRYFRPEILAALDWRRENYPTITGRRAITVNNYAAGGQFQWSGLRGPASPEFKRHSGHSFGAAIDDRAEGCTPDAMRAWILEQ